ncbi:MAG: hypothetical protein WC455_20355 [Dehalococcoidia bacterium]|jgi:hypothetical protein
MKMTFEFEVDVQDVSPIIAVSLSIKRQGQERWDTGASFYFSRPQRIRNGKHLHITESVATVIKVGDQTETPNMKAEAPK